MDQPPANPEFRITPQLVLGLLIISVGVVFTLDQLGYGSAISFLKFWPMAIVAIGIAKMSYATRGGGALAGLIFTVVGLWLQAEALGWLDISLREVWPIILVVFGGYLVWQGLTKQDARPPAASTPPVDSIPFSEARPSASTWSPSAPPTPVINTSTRSSDANATMTAMAFLGGVSRGNNSTAFRGADLVAVMGGCEIDLRRAAINGEAVIDVFALWGGIEIRVPEDWTVVSKIVPLMGGVEDQTRPPQGATAHRLVLRGFVVMGGVEIKN
jgi:predicted membrane protein